VLSKSTFRSAVALGAIAILLSCVPTVSAASITGFKKRADAACASAGAQIEKLSPPITVAVIEKQLTIVSGLVSKLQTITAPAAQAAKFKTFIAQTNAQVTGVQAALAASSNGDTAAEKKDLEKVTRESNASNATARKLGLAACAKNYSPQGK
jgi:hypothetical protein